MWILDEEHEKKNTNKTSQYSEYETKSQILNPLRNSTLDENIEVTVTPVIGASLGRGYPRYCPNENLHISIIYAKIEAILEKAENMTQSVCFNTDYKQIRIQAFENLGGKPYLNKDHKQ